MTAPAKIRAIKGLLDLALPQAGIDLPRAGRALRGLPKFVRQYRDFRARSIRAGYPPPSVRLLYPIIGDDIEEAGRFDPHYLHQDLWAARRLYELKPAEHYDIGSRVDGFISSALVFCSVTMVDVRPMDNCPLGLLFHQADATRLTFPDASIDSISSLHAIEHFGLGRYGDPLCPEGSSLALRELARVAAPGGRVYVGIPIGRERVMFNAQRILSPSTVLRELEPLRLISFAAVDDAGRFILNADPSDFELADYSCGLFELTRDTLPPLP